MSLSCAFDTSNYTTSFSVCENGTVRLNRKIPIPVERGRRGMRQSDAVFHHTVNLAKITRTLSQRDFDCIGVSSRPRDLDGSYMPCFLSGLACAHVLSDALGVPLYEFSHQQGHIMAALYSTERTDLYYERLIAFHLSGGTTEMLLCENGMVQRIGGTLDISAGKLIDRTGVKLGMTFPCGSQLEQTAQGTDIPQMKIKMFGMDCNLSGFENKIDAMIRTGTCAQSICAFTLGCVCAAVEGMLEAGLTAYGDLPVLFAGGVSANGVLREYFSAKYGAFFPAEEYATDNAAGVALLAQREHDGRKCT